MVIADSLRRYSFYVTQSNGRDRARAHLKAMLMKSPNYTHLNIIDRYGRTDLILRHQCNFIPKTLDSLPNYKSITHTLWGLVVSGTLSGPKTILELESRRFHGKGASFNWVPGLIKRHMDTTQKQLCTLQCRVYAEYSSVETIACANYSVSIFGG